MVTPHFKEEINEIRSPKVLPRLTDATLYDSNILKVISSWTLRCLTLQLPPLVMIWNNTEEFLGDIIREICPFGHSLTHLNMDACSPLPCPWATEAFISHIAAHLLSLKFLRYAANRVSHYLDTAREYTWRWNRKQMHGSLPFTVSIQHAWYPHDQLRLKHDRASVTRVWAWPPG